MISILQGLYVVERNGKGVAEAIVPIREIRPDI